jgi:hypothetical protein
MADVTAGDLVTALNTAWTTGTYAKPVNGIGGAGFSADPKIGKQNLIERADISKPALYASLKQTFRIWFAHPDELAINNCITLINALTLASTIVLSPSNTWFDGTHYNCMLEIVIIQ